MTLGAVLAAAFLAQVPWSPLSDLAPPSSNFGAGAFWDAVGTCVDGSLLVDVNGVRSCYPGSDAATTALVVQAQGAEPTAAVNITGANLVFAAGDGSTCVTIGTFGNCAGDTVTVTFNGSANVLTEGVDWTAETSNAVTCTNLATAISALTGVSAGTCSSAKTCVELDSGYASLSVATSDATCDTVANGTDGQVLAYGFLRSGGVLFADLGTPANGTFVYCSDCNKATPCTGAGNGALAVRLNNAWDCNP